MKSIGVKWLCHRILRRRTHGRARTAAGPQCRPKRLSCLRPRQPGCPHNLAARCWQPQTACALWEGGARASGEAAGWERGQALTPPPAGVPAPGASVPWPAPPTSSSRVVAPGDGGGALAGSVRLGPGTWGSAGRGNTGEGGDATRPLRGAGSALVSVGGRA